MKTEVRVEVYYINPTSGKVDDFRRDLSSILKEDWKITSAVSPSEHYIIYTFERPKQTN